jgi:hypothetical protein
MSTGVRGRRLVVGLYLGIVAFTGVIGYLAAGVVDGITPPAFLFLIEFPATRLGLAAYGALTIGLFLGVLLWLVTIVSERVDDETPGASDEESVVDETDRESVDSGENGADDNRRDEETTDEAGTDDATEGTCVLGL